MNALLSALAIHPSIVQVLFASLCNLPLVNGRVAVAPSAVFAVAPFRGEVVPTDIPIRFARSLVGGLVVLAVLVLVWRAVSILVIGIRHLCRGLGR